MAKSSLMKNHYYIDPKTGRMSITVIFGESLAVLLAEKISPIYKKFDVKGFVLSVKNEVVGKTYTQRVEVIADILKEYLPEKYTDALGILMQILGPANKEETGMFTNFYWLMPVGKFVEKYGLNNFTESIHAIEEITKRNTGEYAIRPYIRMYPQKTIKIMQRWSRSKNFHVRRLASEGSRPKLPWSTKLDVFIDNPEPVFKILENLMEDDVRFVQKSVANNLTDYLKVNKTVAVDFMNNFINSDNKNTQWIINHATRKIKI